MATTTTRGPDDLSEVDRDALRRSLARLRGVDREHHRRLTERVRLRPVEWENAARQASAKVQYVALG